MPNRLLDYLRGKILGSRFTQDYGPSPLPFYGSYTDPYTGKKYGSFHTGVDFVLAGGRGTDVPAPASGKVIHAGWLGGYGNAVKIKGAHGYTYLIAHMDSLFKYRNDQGRIVYDPRYEVKAGDMVRAGEVIGQMGSTGRDSKGRPTSTGPHIHMGIYDPAGRAIDPARPRDNVKDIFYTLYHSLGLGAGYNPGQLFQDAVPDPLKTYGLWSPTSPPPWNPVDGTPDPAPPGANPDPGTPTQPGTPGEPIDAPYPGDGYGYTYEPAGNIVTDILGGIVQKLVGPLLPELGLFVLGGIVLIVGITRLGKEPPVAAITAPITDTVKGIEKRVETIAGVIPAGKGAKAAKAATGAKAVEAAAEGSKE